VQKHAVLTLFGLVFAAILVAWVRPNTTGGTTFLVVFAVLIVNAVGSMFHRMRGKRRSDPGRPVPAQGARENETHDQ
jgi:multisubunit Na+/H+ antiporter MnhG subunit